MAMHDNIELPDDGTHVDLYAVTGVARGTEIRWQNLGNTKVFDYSDNVAAPLDNSRFKTLDTGEEHRAVGDQFVEVWGSNGGLISVESV